MKQLTIFDDEPDQAASGLPGGGLRAVVDHLRFISEETNWAVLGVTMEGEDDVVCAVGTMYRPFPGDTVVLYGEWVDDQRFGRQFKFENYAPTLPDNAEQARAYLSSGRIPGIGEATAGAIVDHFGDETIRVLDESIERIEEVPGIGPKKRAVIATGWAESAQQRAIAFTLANVGAPVGLCGPLWDAFGSEAARMITEAPYDLTGARGVGFDTCDRIAQGLGWDRSDPRRIRAELAYTIERAQGDGHCYLPVPKLVEQAARLLDVEADAAAAAVAEAEAAELLVCEGDRAYTPRMAYLESELSEHVLRLAGGGVEAPTASQRERIEDLLSERGLTGEQEQAVLAVLAGAVTVMTGGPGVGKSHTVATVALAAEICRWQVALCAPTGRAAQRMSELADGAQASTVHRLLGLGGGERGADYDPDHPLGVDLVVCDESSMLDVSLARHLFRAVRTGARVLLVGDVDQLPSVGPGSVLNDIIASGRARTVALTKIHRQKEGSGIVQVAHAVNQGDFPSLSRWSDLHFWKSRDADQAASQVVSMVCDRIPNAFGIPATEIQVLAPKRGGSCGVNALNRRLQDMLNPFRGQQYETVIGGQKVAFRPGDRAMVVHNNYDKGVQGIFNGTPVRVVRVNAEPEGDDPAVVIETDEGEQIPYERKEVSQLALAYAITIHKSQGSQYQCTVIPVTNQAFIMLRQNLLYTAITRASELVVLVGEVHAIGKAIATEDSSKRYTGLAERLALG